MVGEQKPDWTIRAEHSVGESWITRIQDQIKLILRTYLLHH
jgi:hypothetical protein